MVNRVEVKETGREDKSSGDSEVRTDQETINKSKTMPTGVKQELAHKQKIIETK